MRDQGGQSDTAARSRRLPGVASGQWNSVSSTRRPLDRAERLQHSSPLRPYPLDPLKRARILHERAASLTGEVTWQFRRAGARLVTAGWPAAYTGCLTRNPRITRTVIAWRMCRAFEQCHAMSPRASGLPFILGAFIAASITFPLAAQENSLIDRRVHCSPPKTSGRQRRPSMPMVQAAMIGLRRIWRRRSSTTRSPRDRGQTKLPALVQNGAETSGHARDANNSSPNS